MMKGTGKISIHAEEKKKKRKRGKFSDNCEALGMKVGGEGMALIQYYLLFVSIILLPK